MMYSVKGRKRLFNLAAGTVLTMSLWAPLLAQADETQDLRKKVDELQKTLDDVDKRLNKAEMHTATDKLSLGVDFRTEADSIHYSDMLFAPSALVGKFFMPFTNVTDMNSGFNGVNLIQAKQMLAGMKQYNLIPAAEKYDIDNDIIYTSKFRLNMGAKINNNLSFTSRLAAYKVWGDSSGTKFNQGSLGDVTFDGNTSSLPHGDTLHLERAYFNYKNQVKTVPINFSLGRRPSTEGPPAEYGLNSLEAGSPLATIINWQFDGASLSFGLDEMTGVPGAALKFCYGVGFESDWGNSGSLSSTSSVKDVHLFGFITTLIDNDMTSAVFNYAHASNITDGFTGLTVMPFIVKKEDKLNAAGTGSDGVNEYYFDTNPGGYISRMEPSTNIGDWDAASMLLRSNLANIDMFLAGSWSHTDPSQISQNPFYELMGQGLLSSNGQLEAHNGYSVYAGVVIPMPADAKLGIEYNWGSKYWFNFTGAEDSLIASKQAARGQVVETYYIQPIIEKTFFVKVGAQYFDYAYTGSGSPLGAPVKISEANGMDSLFPVVDKVWNGYISANVRF